MRILHVINAEKSFGKTAFFKKLSFLLKKNNIKQYICHSPNKHLTSFLNNYKIPNKKIKFTNKGLSLLSKTKYYKIKKRFKPNFIFLWGETENKVITSDSIITVSFAFDNVFKKDFDFKSYNNTDFIIANSPEIIEKFKTKNFTSKNLIYLPTLILKTKIMPINKKDLYIPEHKTFIFSYGNFNDNKDFTVLFNAITLNPEVYLAIAGDGEKRKEIETEAQKAGVKPRVRFIGWQEDIGSFLKACDFFVYTAAKDTIGNIILEALSYNAPVLAYQTTASEKYIKDGENGYLASLTNKYELTKKIQMLIKNPEFKENIIGKSEKITEKFIAQNIVKKYIETLKNIYSDYTKRHNLITDD